MLFFKNKRGFSLAEIMIVVVILGILTAVAIPVYQGISKNQRLNDCTMNRQMISIVVQEGMTGMLDNGKKQNEINMSRISGAISATQVFPVELSYEYVYDNEGNLQPGDEEKYCLILSTTSPTLGDIRGGYRTSGDYNDGCEAGFFLKRSDLADVKMYTKLANQEIPQCAFEEVDNKEYNYYIFSDGTVLCDCPECIEAVIESMK